MILPNIFNTSVEPPVISAQILLPANVDVNKSKDIFKIGRTGNIRKRLQAYATGKEKHPDIEFILIVEDDITFLDPEMFKNQINKFFR